MAKKSMLERESRRLRTVEKYRERRSHLKAAIKDASISYDDRMQAIAELQKLPRNASPCRGRNRCSITGRPRGYYRKFGLGRNKLREHAMQGDIPGLVMASW